MGSAGGGRLGLVVPGVEDSDTGTDEVSHSASYEGEIMLESCCCDEQVWLCVDAAFRLTFVEPESPAQHDLFGNWKHTVGE